MSDQWIEILLWNVGIDCNQLPLGNVYGLGDYFGLVIYKEWKKVPSLENIKNLRLVVVQLKVNPAKHGEELRQDWEGWKVGKDLAKDIIA